MLPKGGVAMVQDMETLVCWSAETVSAGTFDGESNKDHHSNGHSTYYDGMTPGEYLG